MRIAHLIELNQGASFKSDGHRASLYLLPGWDPIHQGVCGPCSVGCGLQSSPALLGKMDVLNIPSTLPKVLVLLSEMREVCK